MSHGISRDLVVFQDSVKKMQIKINQAILQKLTQNGDGIALLLYHLPACGVHSALYDAVHHCFAYNPDLNHTLTKATIATVNTDYSIRGFIIKFTLSLQWRHIRVNASQITGNSTIGFQVVQSNNKENIKASKYRPFVRGLYRWYVVSHHQDPMMKKTFPYHDFIVDELYVNRIGLFYPQILHGFNWQPEPLFLTEIN